MNAFAKQITPYFLKIKNPRDMQQLLEGIMTPPELRTLAMRFEIVKLLKKGVPQHTIAEKLGVGIATVTRGSRELQQGKFKDV